MTPTPYNPPFRVGQGQDLHRFSRERKLFLCGVEIPSDLGLEGHSDADVALHALMDALLGALGERDIGFHFPNSSSEFKGVSSRRLLHEVMGKVGQAGYRVGNANITIIAEKPKISQYVSDMRAVVAEDLQVDISCIAIKATTAERLGSIGREEGIYASAVVLIYRYDAPLTVAQ